MNSSTATHAAAKELPFDVKLPVGFFTARAINDGTAGNDEETNRQVAEHFATQQQQQQENESVDMEDSRNIKSGTVGENSDYIVKSLSQLGASRIEIKTKKRKSNQVDEESSPTEKKNNNSTLHDEESSEIKETSFTRVNYFSANQNMLFNLLFRIIFC